MTTSDRTPYEILGVPKTIGYVQLRGIYRTKIHEHLQKQISPINFRHICRAYETLSDFDKRKRYDSETKWISELPIDQYTPQQLAAEPDLIRDLKQRIRDANLTTINAQDPITGHTTLYTAARVGNVEAVKFLTEQGAEPDLSQRTKSTALHVASFYGHANVVRYLLESGADYRIKNQGLSTAEDEAYNDDVKKVFTELKQNAYVRAAANELDWFLQNGLTQHQDTEYFSQRQTLLHCASKKGHSNLVRWLVEKQSANFDLVDVNGNSPLHLAAYGGHKDIVEYLLNCGCDPTLRNHWGTMAEEEGMKHGTNITDLFKTIRERDMFEMARTGIAWWFYYYFSSNLKDMIDSEGISLLYYACRYGQYSVVKWLLERGSNVNILMKKEPKSTPLHGAKYRGHVAIVELLLEYGADVNIKNGFGTNVFEETISPEVDEDTSNKIKQILLQYERNLKSDNLIDVYIYEDNDSKAEPVVKTKVSLNATYTHLLETLSKCSNEEYPHFSIARRPLVFKNKETTLISAVGCSRYAYSKFIDTPIRLIRHKELPNNSQNIQLTHQEPNIPLRQYIRDFQNHERCKTKTFTLKAPLTTMQTINMDNLTFTFAVGSLKEDIELTVTALFKPDGQKFDLPGCICLFKVEFNKPKEAILELPSVSMTNDTGARLYTLAQPSTFWFSSNTRRTHLPSLLGLHAFICHISVIPDQLTLPADMFIAATLEQPLKVRDSPVSCKCLVLRQHEPSQYPFIAYHGTNIQAIRSILHDGLVTPGTITASGVRVNPPKYHIARGTEAFGVKDFSAAIFLSPSIYYSSDSTYAVSFSNGDQQMIVVLECSVKKNSYNSYCSTVPNYKAHPSDDINAIEWRVTNPANIEINAILFITKIESIDKAKKERSAKTS